MLTESDTDLSRWQRLSDDLIASEDGVERGRMMSSDAVTFGGKVFAFFTTKGRFAGLGVRLGRETDVFSLKLSEWEYLAPFKTKPPMMDWILIGASDRDRWPELARLGLDIMRSAAESKAVKKGTRG